MAQPLGGRLRTTRQSGLTSPDQVRTPMPQRLSCLSEGCPVQRFDLARTILSETI